MKTALPEVDGRAVRLRDPYLPYALPEFRARQEWHVHASELRKHILSVCGLLPMPAAPPLRAQVFGTIEYRDYSVSKVFFQSHPGLLVTGNLFVPRGRSGPFPAVLNPHGHWSQGRLVHCQDASLPARGTSFARQGYVALCYDMIGYNDSTQLGHSQGPGGDTLRQELWGLGLMALQTYNSIRAVDFLQSLPSVDPERIGCTGESGGGTQTFILAALDDRITVAAPVNMVSAHMQGGCRCENAPSLRLDATNPEIAALVAPRPMLLVSATGDWTKNTPTVEYPYIRGIYRLFGAADRLASHQVDAGHNYNLASRNAVYPFFAKWLLGADHPEEFAERPFRLRAKKHYLVWADRKRPRFAPEGDALINRLVKRRASALRDSWPRDRRQFGRFVAESGSALRHLLSTEVPTRSELQASVLRRSRRGDVADADLVLSRVAAGDRVPARLLSPPARRRSGSAVLVVSPDGTDALIGDTSGGAYPPLVESLLEAGHLVLSVDCWGTGRAQLPDGHADAVARTRFYLTYNRSDDANRVQDILTGLGYLRSRAGAGSLCLLGLGRAGLWTILARTQAPFVDRTIADLDRFPADRDDAYSSRLFVPGLRSIGGIETALALIAPGALCLYNVGTRVATAAVADAYRAAGAERRVVISEDPIGDLEIARRISEA